MTTLQDLNSLKEFQLDIMGIKMVIDIEKLINHVIINPDKDTPISGEFAIFISYSY